MPLPFAHMQSKELREPLEVKRTLRIAQFSPPDPKVRRRGVGERGRGLVDIFVCASYMR